jgi:hypothetical protein
MSHMHSQKLLDQISDLWEELRITQLLEQYVPLNRRYLVDRLLRILAGVEDVEDDRQLRIPAGVEDVED